MPEPGVGGVNFSQFGYMAITIQEYCMGVCSCLRGMHGDARESVCRTRGLA